MRRLTLALLVLGALACATPVEPNLERPRFNLDTQWSDVVSPAFTLTPDVVHDGELLTITGALLTPTPCFTLIADVVRMGDAMIVWMTAVRMGAGCFQDASDLQYRLRVGADHVPRRLVVHHGYKDFGPPTDYRVVRDIRLAP